MMNAVVSMEESTISFTNSGGRILDKVGFEDIAFVGRPEASHKVDKKREASQGNNLDAIVSFDESMVTFTDRQGNVKDRVSFKDLSWSGC
ncbi:MAG: hypothetical protein HY730_00225 [Candidatus Tectomicrobia bacterium]|uniref:Uncharacterized protein n=1 Tax=Tectimicrobiota bacterium TaxID=2528274 RepID=A0A933GJ27_UNCTE|nr:hypothetical protein [Candidatus Tectomicrobia bacterium]